MDVRRRQFLACWVATAVAATGCGALDNMDFQGTYTLVAINGKKLPVAASDAVGVPPIKSGSITLNYGGTFVNVLSSDGPGGQAVNRESTGTYEVSPLGRTVGRFEQAPPLRIDLSWKGAGVTQSFLDVKTLTVDRDGAKFEYRYARPPSGTPTPARRPAPAPAA